MRRMVREPGLVGAARPVTISRLPGVTPAISRRPVHITIRCPVPSETVASSHGEPLCGTMRIEAISPITVISERASISLIWVQEACPPQNNRNDSLSRTAIGVERRFAKLRIPIPLFEHLSRPCFYFGLIATESGSGQVPRFLTISARRHQTQALPVWLAGGYDHRPTYPRRP